MVFQHLNSAKWLSLSWIARWTHSGLGVTMATGVVRRAGELVLFIATSVDYGTAATPNSLGLPDGRIPFSRCLMVGLFAVLRSLATPWQLMFSDLRDPLFFFIAASLRLGMPLIFKGDLT